MEQVQNVREHTMPGCSKKLDGFFRSGYNKRQKDHVLEGIESKSNGRACKSEGVANDSAISER